MKETWFKSVELSMIKLGGKASLKELYVEVKNRREVLGLSLPKNLEAVVRKEIEYNSSDSSNWRGNRDVFYSVIGIGGGVWGLVSELPTTPKAVATHLDDIHTETKKSKYTVLRILRDTKIIQKLKSIYKNRCQFCDHSVPLADGKAYSEGHHIKPLGSPHLGPDVESNILIVCPNHHVMLDYGSIKINLEELEKKLKHQIDKEFVEYHNSEIFDQH